MGVGVYLHIETNVSFLLVSVSLLPEHVLIEDCFLSPLCNVFLLCYLAHCFRNGSKCCSRIRVQEQMNIRDYKCLRGNLILIISGIYSAYCGSQAFEYAHRERIQILQKALL